MSCIYKLRRCLHKVNSNISTNKRTNVNLKGKISYKFFIIELSWFPLKINKRTMSRTINGLESEKKHVQTGIKMLRKGVVFVLRFPAIVKCETLKNVRIYTYIYIYIYVKGVVYVLRFTVIVKCETLKYVRIYIYI